MHAHAHQFVCMYVGYICVCMCVDSYACALSSSEDQLYVLKLAGGLSKCMAGLWISGYLITLGVALLGPRLKVLNPPKRAPFVRLWTAVSMGSNNCQGTFLTKCCEDRLKTMPAMFLMIPTCLHGISQMYLKSLLLLWRPPRQLPGQRWFFPSDMGDSRASTHSHRASSQHLVFYCAVFAHQALMRLQGPAKYVKQWPLKLFFRFWAIL